MLVMVALASPMGCSVCQYARLTAYEEPKLFNDECDDKASMAAYRAMADKAWHEAGVCCPEECFEGDYAYGFREGFAEFVYAGGNGEPPAVPPRPYWQLDVRSGEGGQAIKSWYEGYRHGARIARDGGYRRATTLTVSASLRDCGACGCPGDELTPHRPTTPSGPSFQASEPFEPAQPEIILPEPTSPEATPGEAPEPTPLPEPPAPGEFEAAPPEYEATTISLSGRSGQPVNALFQIVR